MAKTPAAEQDAVLEPAATPVAEAPAPLTLKDRIVLAFAEAQQTCDLIGINNVGHPVFAVVFDALIRNT